MDNYEKRMGSEEDEDCTVFGGSAPVSRFSTTRGPGIVKRRPWGTKFAADLEKAAGKDSSLTQLLHRGSMVSSSFIIFTLILKTISV
jgi:hypothetical protein